MLSKYCRMARERVPGPLGLEGLQRDTRLKDIGGTQTRPAPGMHRKKETEGNSWGVGRCTGTVTTVAVTVRGRMVMAMAVPVRSLRVRTGAVVHSEVGQRQGPGHMVYIQP